MSKQTKKTSRPIVTILTFLVLAFLALNLLIIVLELFDIPTKLIYWYEKV